MTTKENFTGATLFTFCCGQDGQEGLSQKLLLVEGNFPRNEDISRVCCVKYNKDKVIAKSRHVIRKLFERVQCSRCWEWLLLLNFGRCTFKMVGN